MARLLKGFEVASNLKDRVIKEIDHLLSLGCQPVLAIVRVGEKSDDIAYERSISKCCNTLGVGVKQFVLEKEVSQDTLIQTIKELNCDSSIHGILLFRPLPKHLDEEVACMSISPEKDVDGVTDSSMIGVYAGKAQGFPPCTPQACMELLDYYGINCAGKKAVVVGRSMVVGKPVAMMLLSRNATITVCHTRTTNLPTVCREADILLAAVGRAGVITKNYVQEGQIVIDVGINVDEGGKLCGDVDFASVEPIVEAITPVPGGIGTVTTFVLTSHVVEAAKRQFGHC